MLGVGMVSFEYIGVNVFEPLTGHLVGLKVKFR